MPRIDQWGSAKTTQSDVDVGARNEQVFHGGRVTTAAAGADIEEANYWAGVRLTFEHGVNWRDSAEGLSATLVAQGTGKVRLKYGSKQVGCNPGDFCFDSDCPHWGPRNSNHCDEWIEANYIPYSGNPSFQIHRDCPVGAVLLRFEAPWHNSTGYADNPSS